jgi:hypothetical protein
MSAVSVQSAANVVAVMVAAVLVGVAVRAVIAPKAALSARANAVLSEAKAALIHVANAALKVVLRAVLNVLQPKGVAKMVAMRNAPAKLAQTYALRANLAVKVKPAAKAVVTAIAVIVQNAQSELSVALNAPEHPATQRKKSWRWLIRPLWPPLQEVM